MSICSSHSLLKFLAGVAVAVLVPQQVDAQSKGQVYAYPVNFLCGPSSESFQEGTVAGVSHTAVHILNPSGRDVRFEKRVSRALPYQVEGAHGDRIRDSIGPLGAIEIECNEIRQMLPSPMTEEFRSGYLMLRAEAQLVVTVTYSARPHNGEISTLDVQRVSPIRTRQGPEPGGDDDEPRGDDVGVVGPRVNDRSFVATVKPNRTEGAPYPPVDFPPRTSFMPNADWFMWPRVPDGPRRGDLAPLNPPTDMRSFEEGPSQEAPPIEFDDYEEVDDVLPNLGDLGEVSVAEATDVVMMTGNTWMAFSEDTGATFTYINPTTIFPQDDGGLCCDQVVLHLPRRDLFVWLLQYRSTEARDGTNDNRLRLAVATSQEIRDSDAKAWTYWDFSSNQFSAAGGLDYNDLTATRSNVYWISSIAGGRVVARLPLEQLAARTTVTYRYTAGTNAAFSHITQNAENEVYSGGHVDRSQLRVYNWPEGDNSYYWRNTNINSWPNDSETAITPDGIDWMQWESGITTYVYGNALQRDSVWFAWQAGRGGGFPHPHVQMVRLDTSSFALQEQVQIWNPDHAFQDAFLSTNQGGEFGSGSELGISIGFGGPPFHGSHAVGVWGDFVVNYPELSTRSATRWGDYNTSRRSSSNPQRWVAGGYTLQTDSDGNNTTVPHYIRFGR